MTTIISFKLASELRTTIVAFPHSQVVYSLDEVNEVQGQYELRSLEIPYVENVINSVVGLYVSHEGTHLVIVTAVGYSFHNRFLSN
jgi:hypothetical protein